MTAPFYYNWSSFPQWADGGFGSATETPGEVAPASFATGTGYNLNQGRLSDQPYPGLPAGRRGRALAYSNANFCDGAYYFPLFINSLELDLSLAGSTAQSQMTRDFYPHNMVMPGFNITGQCYDQTSYGELCEFVHAAQHRAFDPPSTSTTGPNILIQLYVQGNVYPLRQGTRTLTQSGLGVTVNGKVNPNQIIKGQHQPIICLGYIMSMPRVHQQGDYAPTWSCQFTVSNMLSGPYTDSVGYNVATGNWLNVLLGKGGSPTHSQDFTNTADKAQNKKDLTWVAANSANILNQPAQPAAAGTPATGPTGITPSTPNGGYTRQTWAQAFLGMLGIPATSQAVSNIVAWEAGEGGAGPQFGVANNTADYNPLNTTQVPASGSYTNTGTQGNIKAYSSWAQGLTATVTTILSGQYAAILSTISGPYSAFATAVNDSKWGTHDL